MEQVNTQTNVLLPQISLLPGSKSSIKSFHINIFTAVERLNSIFSYILQLSDYHKNPATCILTPPTSLLAFVVAALCTESMLLKANFQRAVFTSDHHL